MPPKKRRRNSTKLGPADLFVPLPKGDTAPLLRRELLQRLIDTGYTTMAWTHTVYGVPHPERDAISKTMPQDTHNIRILRRLHMVIEQLNDVVPATTPHEWKKEYDIISVAPRTVEIQKAVVSQAGLVDILTLEGKMMDLSIKGFDGVVELLLAPALLNRTPRMQLVQTARIFQKASAGTKIPLVISSGDRRFEEKDVGVLALRRPDDVRNLLEVVCGFRPKMSQPAVMGGAAQCVLDHAHRRRWGKSDVVRVRVGTIEEKERASRVEAKGGEAVVAAEESGAEDGFMAL